MTEYQRRYRWRRTWQGDPVPAEDYVCVVDGETVGRIIYKESQPGKFHWYWFSGHSRKIHANIMPQDGKVSTRQEAIRIIEERYDAQREMAGLPSAEAVNVKGA